MSELDLDQLKINTQELKTVKDILSLEIPDTSVIAFGSRVTGKSRPYSDLDLALMTEAPLNLSKLASIKNAFDRSDLVWSVDIIDWSTTSDRFRNIIKAAYIRIQ